MDALIRLFTETPLPRFLIVAGILFLLLFVLGKLGAKIVVDPRRQKYAGIIGAILLFAGVVLDINPPPGPYPDNDQPLINADFLINKTWQFRHGRGSVIAEEIRLLPDRRIDMGKYYHPNESRWGLEGNTLVFYHKSGEPSCRFTSVGIEHGKTVLSGPLLFDPSGATQHVLREW